jgi:adenine phosphoribosyltransferase
MQLIQILTHGDELFQLPDACDAKHSQRTLAHKLHGMAIRQNDVAAKSDRTASTSPVDTGEKMSRVINLKDHIRSVPDFPKPGILFYDISTLLAHPKAWSETIDRMAQALHPYKPDVLVGIESRGFLLAAPLALKLGTGFVMLRKRGKLPGATIGLSYGLEYGTDTLEIQQNAIKKGVRAVVVDDLLATGGTMAAGVALLAQVGAVVPAAACVIELAFLNGRGQLTVPLESLLQYDS